LSRSDALVRGARVSDGFARLLSEQRLEEFKLARERVRRGSRCDTTARTGCKARLERSPPPSRRWLPSAP
jgi:hypothetical protein